MNVELAVTLAREGMKDALRRALMVPIEPEIAASAEHYVSAIEAGEWDDDIEVVLHLWGYFDCQLNWWRAMSDKDRRNVAFYRAVKTAYKYPKKPTARTYSATIDAILKKGGWGFTARGLATENALAFGAAYEGDGPDFLKRANRIGTTPVRTRGTAGGRKSGARRAAT